MTRREFGGLLVLLLVGMAASYVAAPGLAALVLIGGTFALAVADHRVAARRAEAEARRERLIAAAKRHGYRQSTLTEFESCDGKW